MLFTIGKNQIQRELHLIQGVIEKKNTIPILSNLLIETEEKHIKMVATDLEVGLRCKSEATVNKEGSVTISAKKLYEIVRALPESDIKFEKIDNNWVSIECERSQFKIVGLPKEDFPSLPEFDFAEGIPISADLLKEMIHKTSFAISEEDTRYSLNGALFVIQGKQMSMVATDAHRLAWFKTEAEKNLSEDEIRVIIPKKTVQQIKAIIDDGGKEAIFGRSENHVFFKLEDKILVSRIIEGQFPNYEKVIPVDNDKVVIFPAKDFTDAIKRVSLLSNERSRAIKFYINPGKVEIRSSNPELGEACELLYVPYQGEKVKIGFNAQYIIDFLNVVEDKEIKFEMKDETSQGLLTPAEAHAYQYTYVVMPMRI